jgi:hypothetical protein
MLSPTGVTGLVEIGLDSPELVVPNKLLNIILITDLIMACV